MASGVNGWDERIASELGAIKEAGRWRHLRSFDGIGPESDRLVSFAGNDYLGLSRHRHVVAAATEAIEQWGAGATASRLIAGTRPIHLELEEALAEWKKCERAVVFASGYQANVGVLTSLGVEGVTILSDELNHASIIDGCRLARAKTVVYRHNDLDHLKSRLGEVSGPVLVVTDSVFSMDGDVAHVEAIGELCASHGDAILVVDEAHAVPGFEPTFDSRGLGCDLVRVGTMSKTLGSQGGFVCGDSAAIDLLVNRARSLIYSTGLAPGSAAAAFAALEIVTSAEGDVLTNRLRSIVDRVAPGHPSPIVPVIVGAEQHAVALAEALHADGLWIPAIRPPTVPPGTCRLRIALSSDHTDAHIDKLLAAIASHDLPIDPGPDR